MFRLARLACPLLAVAVATAAPVPKAKPVAISPANADRVEVVRELDADVWRVVPGPAAGELTLVMWEKPIEVADAVTLKPLRTVVDAKAIHFAATADDARHAWAVNGSKVWVKATAAKGVVEIETGQQQPSLAFSPDGKTLATGGYGDEAKVWDAAGKLLHTLPLTGQGGLTPEFSPDGRVLAVGNRNHETRLFDAATGKLLHTLPQKMTQGLSFSPDGKRLAAGYVDGTVGVWDVAKGERLQSAKSGCEEVYAVAWSPAGDLLVTTGRRGKVVLWKPDTLEKLRELEAGDWVISAAFSPDGSNLYTAGGAERKGGKRMLTAWAVGGK